jgi:ribosomal protein L9
MNDCPKVERAARFLLLATAGSKKMNVSEALAWAGFSTDESMDRTLQKSVYRKRDKLKQLPKPSPLSKRTENLGGLQVSPPRRPHRTSISTSAIKRSMKEGPKKMRLTSKQAHGTQKQKAKLRDHVVAHTKKATKLWAEELQNQKKAKDAGKSYNKVSAETIVKEINAKENLSIKPRTVRNHVKNGQVDVTPIKRGVKSSVPPRAYKALCGAFESFVKLASQSGRMKVDRPSLAKRLNAVLNKHPDESRKTKNLLWRIQDDLAGTLDLDEPNRIEL